MTSTPLTPFQQNAADAIKTGDISLAKYLLTISGMLPDAADEFIANHQPHKKSSMPVTAAAVAAKNAVTEASAPVVETPQEPVPAPAAPNEVPTDIASRYQQYSEYLTAIFKPKDVICFVLIEHNKDGDDKKERVAQKFTTLEDALTMETFLNLVAANDQPSTVEGNSESSVYVAMNAYRPELNGKSIGRTQENVLEVRALQSDADDENRAASVVSAMQSGQTVPAPSIVVESSTGKRQAIWAVDDFLKHDAKPVMQAIASTFGTDSAVAEVARVMRVPGFVNRKHKYADKPVAKLLSHTGKRYSRTDFRVEVTPESEQRVSPDEYLNAPFIRKGGSYGGIYPHVLKIVGHYVGTIKDSDVMFDIVKGCKERNGCFYHDGVTPYEWNEGQVRDQCHKLVKEWKDQSRSVALNQNAEVNEVKEKKKSVAQPPIEVTSELLLKEFPAYDGTEPDELPMLIESFMPKGVGFFGSLSGTGKTWVGLSVAKALSSGMPLWGVFPVKRKTAVLYLIPEASDASFKRRLGKMKITQDKNLFRYRTITQGITRPLSDPVTVAMIQQLGATCDVLVIVDTAVRFFRGGDENAAKENNLVQDSDMLRSIGANVLFLHHSPKATKDAAELTLENALRGTGDFGAMADFVYAFRRDEKAFAQGEGPEEIEVVCVKPRDFEPPLPFRLQLKRKARHGEQGPTVSVIDETGNLGYIGNATVKSDHEKLLADIFHENPYVSFNDLCDLLKMKRESVRGFCKRNGGWKQVSEPAPGARGRTVTRKKWTQGLLMAGQVEQTTCEPVPSGPSVSLDAVTEASPGEDRPVHSMVTVEDVTVGS
jgi:AAA domain/RepB DNA-primase from phage plasmid